MKTIVAIKPACKNPRSLLRHVFLANGRLPREVEPFLENGSRVVGIINGLDIGTVTQIPSVDANTLCADVPAGRAALRHVILSVEDTFAPDGRSKAFEALTDLAEQWIEKYAAGANFIGVLHDDRAHPHCHLLISNNDDFAGGSRLAWGPAVLKEMQSMSWVAEATRQKFSIETGRNNGVSRREGSGSPYPAAHLDAAILAKATNQELEYYERTKQLSISRRNRQGEATSVNFNGRRIRLSTIRTMGAACGVDDKCRQGNYRRTRTKRPSRSLS